MISSCSIVWQDPKCTDGSHAGYLESRMMSRICPFPACLKRTSFPSPSLRQFLLYRDGIGPIGALKCDTSPEPHSIQSFTEKLLECAQAGTLQAEYVVKFQIGGTPPSTLQISNLDNCQYRPSKTSAGGVRGDDRRHSIQPFPQDSTEQYSKKSMQHVSPKLWTLIPPPFARCRLQRAD